MIRLAESADFETVRSVTHTTVSEIYPHYYPPGAVAFFLRHHSEARIREDIAAGAVYLCTDETGAEADPAAGSAVGTVTVRNSEISRLFVLPQYQGRGFGRALLDFAERTVFAAFDEVTVDVSFSAKPIYLKRGYREVAYHTIRTPEGDFLCYDVMRKSRPQ